MLGTGINRVADTIEWWISSDSGAERVGDQGLRANVPVVLRFGDGGIFGEEVESGRGGESCGEVEGKDGEGEW